VERLTNAGVEMGVATTPEKFAAQMDAAYKRWTQVVD
jgi:hypothetical protein